MAKMSQVCVPMRADLWNLARARTRRKAGRTAVAPVASEAARAKTGKVASVFPYVCGTIGIRPAVTQANITRPLCG